MLQADDNPEAATGVQKETHNPRQIWGILLGVAFPARNKCCLAGLETGARLCVRGSISDFATLVRKSYSDSLRLVSTLVLLERISYSANGLGTLEIPNNPQFAGRKDPEAASG